MRIIGITGGIASGKSTVTKYLTSKKYLVIDADIISRQLLSKNSKVYYKVVNVFGEEILLDDRNINRRKLGEIVFSDKKKLEILNSIMHPVVHDFIQQQIDLAREHFGDGIIFIDSPLLIETGFYSIVDEVWLVYITREEQIERIMKRDNLSREKAINIIENQMSLESKITKANRVIENSGTINDLENNIDNLLRGKCNE